MYKILIVDDSKFMRQVLKTMLSKHGFNDVIEAANGMEAIELYKTEKPNVVILDIIMPEKDGFSTLMDIIKTDDKANIIGCSASCNKDVTNKFVAENIKGFIVKPVIEKELISTINRILVDIQ